MKTINEFEILPILRRLAKLEERINFLEIQYYKKKGDENGRNQMQCKRM